MRLNSSIKEVKGIGDKTAGLFLKINIETIRDLISYFPRTYVQFPEIKRPDEVVEGETAAVIADPADSDCEESAQHADHGDFDCRHGKTPGTGVVSASIHQKQPSSGRKLCVLRQGTTQKRKVCHGAAGNLYAGKI